MSGTLTYPDLVAELFPRLTGGIRWGLDRTEQLLESVGNPHLSYATIHVGGTNGKGSVAALLEGALRAAGHRTGLYTSPHLCTLRERVQVGGVPLSEGSLVAAAERLWPLVERLQPSFFETTTAMGLLALAEAGVAVAVVEVGLGGRLDATNVVRPDLVVLTNVTLDHVQLLGDSLAAVAQEKAGIIKAGVPAVTAETAAAPLGVFRRRAAEVGAPLHELDLGRVHTRHLGSRLSELALETEAWGTLELAVPLPGAHQVLNAALAGLALEHLPTSMRPSSAALVEGFAGVRWPGRLQAEEVAGVPWLFDVAHNVAGAEALGAALEALRPARPIVALIGVLGDKDWRGMLAPLYAAVDAAVLTLPPSAPAERRWEPQVVLEAFPAAHAEAVADFTTALERAQELARSGVPGAPAGRRPGTVLVTGSFHTVGDALLALGRAPWGGDLAVRAPAFAR
ncbi:MAG: Mur ligase family protein [Gemmatimonadota bacterium]